MVIATASIVTTSCMDILDRSHGHLQTKRTTVESAIGASRGLECISISWNAWITAKMTVIAKRQRIIQRNLHATTVMSEHSAINTP